VIEDLWFGNTQLFQNLPMPARITRSRLGYVETMSFEDGGGAVARSRAYQQEFEMVYPWGEASGQASIEAFADYAAGEYGDQLCWFANPMAYDTNLVPRFWASPGLIEANFPSGWPNISTGTPVWSATASNSYAQPARKGTWPVTTAANATPLTDETIPYFIIPIPPHRTLHIGFTGAATGTAVVVVESWANGAATAGATATLTPLAETGGTRMNATVSGASYAYAKVYVTRTSSAASTITLISMMAQLWETGDTPTLTGPHVRGQGHTGLEFVDGAAVEEWTDASAGKHYKGLSARLLEVGAWR
jgi:hypothetical protein